MKTITFNGATTVADAQAIIRRSRAKTLFKKVEMRSLNEAL